MRFVNDYVNVVSNATFWWLNWIFIKGYKKPLEQDDLGDIPKRHQADYNHRKFQKAFGKEKVNKITIVCSSRHKITSPKF